MAVLFVGLSFEGVGSRASAARKPRQTNATGDSPRPPSAGSRLGVATPMVPAAGRPVEEISGGRVAASGEAGEAQGGAGGGQGAARCLPVGGEKAAGEGEPGAGEPAALSLELLQGSFSLLQSIVASHGGVIKELSVDDKGTVRGRPQDRKQSGCRSLIIHYFHRCTEYGLNQGASRNAG